VQTRVKTMIAKRITMVLCLVKRLLLFMARKWFYNSGYFLH